MKLCLIYNFAQHYRAGIFKLLDRTFDCDFFFGKNTTDIKTMDYSLLHGNVTDLDVKKIGPIEYQCGVPSLAFKGYDAIVILIDPKSISCWLLLLYCRLFSKTKIYGWTHGWYGKETKTRSILKKLNFKLADGLFLYGNYAKQLMIAEGFKQEKLHVIHNSLDYENQVEIRKHLSGSKLFTDHFNNDNKNLIFIGRLTPVKKLDMLVTAIKKLNDKGTRVNLTFVGDGSEAELLKKQASQLGVEGQVWFYGACYDDRKNAELIYNADLCVAPGNVGLTAMHTMVFGTPVITHDCFKWQMPEFESIMPGVTGDFFAYENQESMETAIAKWFETHKDREETRLACFKEIDDNWTPEFQIKVFKKVLTK